MSDISIIILILYITFEFATYVTYKTSMTKQIYLYYNSKPTWSKLITEPWYYYRSSFFDSMTISKIQNNKYRFLLEIRNDETKQYTNGYIYIDKDGNVLKEEITESINFWKEWCK